jgi:spermidine synthase
MSTPTSPAKLCNQDGRALFTCKDEGQQIEVREFGDWRWMHFGGDAIQAVMHTVRPDELILPYNRAMLGALLFVQTPHKLLNLGLGCGSFERFFRARMPTLSVTSVESNATVIDLAKQFFFIPERQSICQQSADEFLLQHKHAFDLILCDVFVDDRQPSFIGQAAFYGLLARGLCEAGAIAINLLPKSDDELLKILLAVRRHFTWVWLMEFPDHRNIVLFLMNHEPGEKDALEWRTSELGRSLGVDLSDLPRRLLRLPEKIQD